jgi:error-prone DNA polymerase
MAYAELHCHSNFSFLTGASHVEELVEEAARLGLAGLALTDRDGCYGVVRFAEAARPLALPTVFGAELSVGDTRLVVLAEGAVGYTRLARAISEAQLRGQKGAPRATLAELAAAACAGVHLTRRRPSATNDSWFVLTGSDTGAVPRALVADGPAAARRELDRLVDAFGATRVLVELWDHGDPIDRHRNDALARLAHQAGVEIVAANDVHYATSAQRPLATALAAIRTRRSLDEADGWLPASPLLHLRHPLEQARRFERWPGAVERTVDVATACAFDLRLAAPNLPDHPVPPDHTPMSWLRELVRRGAAIMYPPQHSHHEQAQRQIEHELGVIDQLGFAGYFLLLHDIVEFCRTHDIYCQGRGSSA